ncbi:MAG TPA: hypothetical protein VHX59_19395 [Mycobacteriales bacterium]|nr:hypothetical protein [Mycobacteriales bacterium]
MVDRGTTAERAELAFDSGGLSSAPRGHPRAVAVAAIVVVAIMVRAQFFDFRSGDYTAYVGQWYSYIAAHGGFHALKDNFANYNVPYLYLLAILTYTPVSALLGVKLISVAFDLVLAFFVYRIVGLRHPATWWPVVAGAVVLLLPTVVLNSSMWGQADSIYSSFGIGGLYFLLRRRPWLAMLFFGLAFAFKLQIVFIFPLLLLLALRRYIPWRVLPVIPAVYVVLDLPAILLGASPHDLLTVYSGQTETYSQLTLNAPNVYQYLGDGGDVHLLRDVGIVVTGVLLLALMVPVVVRRLALTPTRIVLAATVSVVVVPYFLPSMHERYFYLADALVVISAFYVPRRLWPLPILEQFASLFSYLPFLLMSTGGGRDPGGFGGGGRAEGAPGQGGAGFRPPGGTTQGGIAGQRSGGFPGAGSGRPAGGGGATGGGFGGMASHTVISFTILSTVMLIAVLLVVAMAIREFRTAVAPEALADT